MGRASVDDEMTRSLRLLREALERLDVVVRSEPMPDEAHLRGGLFHAGGRAQVVVSPRASVAEQLEVLVDALRRLDTDELWLPPAVRRLLDDEE